MKWDISVCCETKWGESIGILGSIDELGRWKESDVVVLDTDQDRFPTWTGTLEIPDHVESFEYKYVIIRDGEVRKWESGRKNRILFLGAGAPHGESVPDQFGKIGLEDGGENGHQGSSIENVDLSELEPFAKEVVQSSRDNRSWRRRLEFIRKLFTEGSKAEESTFDINNPIHLVYVEVYLNFLKSGQIPCQEDGSHYRPNHHAKEAQLLDEALERVTTEQNAFLVRKIYPLLPSYNSDFTQSVPLTRIRDIAHRNDIPKHLKDDIKHNLQNKLHRSAGPEDLITCERILQQVTADGTSYSGAFIEQMKIFHRELLEFFNATSLDDRLGDLVNRKEPNSDSNVNISDFLDKKRRMVSSWDQIASLTELRKDFHSSLPSVEGETRQRVRLADIALEDYSFILFADIAQRAEKSELELRTSVEAAKVCAENLALSGIETSETRCIINEFNRLLRGNDCDLLAKKASVDRAIQFTLAFSTSTSALFSGIEKYGQALGVESHAVSVFAEAEIRSNLVFQFSRILTWARLELGRALNLPPWDVLSVGASSGKLIFAENVDDLVKLPPGQAYIAVVKHASGDEDIPQSTKGIVLGHSMPHLSHIGVRARQSQVTFVSSEDSNSFASFSENSRHLEGKVVELRVTADGSVDLVESTFKLENNESESSHKQGVVEISEVSLSGSDFTPISEVSKETAGSKAFAASRLERSKLKAGPKETFETPKSAALPFGAFREALEGRANNQRLMLHQRITALLFSNFSSLSDSSNQDGNYDDLVAEFMKSATPPTVEEHLAPILERIDSHTVKASILSHTKKFFGSQARLMVRSSANCEDLEDMSGAGLYDSIANVPSESHSDLDQAIRDVWKSLWTKRAALSRMQYRVPHDKAFMAVLLQEMIPADYSFIMFSRNPITGSKDEVYMELSVGMGETLASASIRGTPYRATFNRSSNSIHLLSYASFGHAMLPTPSTGLHRVPVDYSQTPLTTNANFRSTLLSRLGHIAIFLETHFGSPQDIEGAITLSPSPSQPPTISIVQTRPMISHHTV